MCGLAGIILGPRHRTAADREALHSLFTRLLLANQTRGRHAAGVARLTGAGASTILKRPVDADALTALPAYARFLAAAGDDTTILMGHTRYRTRGSELNNANNHPIRAGATIGTHNGTITNADKLFARFRLRRRAEVDSELLVRMVDKCWPAEGPDLAKLQTYIAACQGRLTAVFATRRDPSRIVIIKGNNPLTVCFSRPHGAIAYASEESHLEDSIAVGEAWQLLDIPPMTMAVVDAEELRVEAMGRIRLCTT